MSSGLATLPLDYVWVDGKENKSWPTDKMLPTGEMLDGKMAYSEIMAFFTTNEMTPDYVNQLGKEQLKKLYPQVSTQISINQSINQSTLLKHGKWLSKLVLRHAV